MLCHPVPQFRFRPQRGRLRALGHVGTLVCRRQASRPSLPDRSSLPGYGRTYRACLPGGRAGPVPPHAAGVLLPGQQVLTEAHTEVCRLEIPAYPPTELSACAYQTDSTPLSRRARPDGCPAPGEGSEGPPPETGRCRPVSSCYQADTHQYRGSAAPCLRNGYGRGEMDRQSQRPA